MCKIEIPLKSCVILVILSLLEGPDRKKHINSCCFLMIWNLPPESAEAPGIRGSGVRKCCSDPTSTRAGGQDDVS